MGKFDFRNIYFWIHTSFAAVSIAFFIGLLSAGSTTTDALSIEIASVLFCISVVSNSGLSLFLAFFGNGAIYVNRVYITIFPWNEISSLPAISVLSFISAVISLFSYYSYLYMAITIGMIIYTANFLQSIIHKANVASFESDEDSE